MNPKKITANLKRKHSFAVGLLLLFAIGVFFCSSILPACATPDSKSSSAPPYDGTGKGINAADIYKKAGALFKKEEDLQTEIHDVIASGWRDDHESSKEYLRKNQEAINEFKKATKIANCDFSFGGPVEKHILTKLPDHVDNFNLVRLILAEGRLYEEENKFDLALENYIAVLRYANHLGRQNVFIMYSHSLQYIVQREVFDILSRYLKRKTLEPKGCHYLLNNLATFRKGRTGLKEGYEEEREGVKNTVRMAVHELSQKLQYDEEFYQKFYKAYDNFVDAYFEYWYEAFKNNKPEIAEEKINRLLTQMKEETPGNFDDIDRSSLEIESLYDGYFLFPLGIKSPSILAFLLSGMLVEEDLQGRKRGIAKLYTSFSEFDLLTTAVAIRLFELRHGEAPNSLQELTPIYLDHVLEDPFNGFSPLSYKKLEEDWLLYSFGPNNQDDQGVGDDIIFYSHEDTTKKHTKTYNESGKLISEE